MEINLDKHAPEGAIRPAWGLTAAIPEGVIVSWGARALYSWRQVTQQLRTPTGKVKKSRGHALTSTTFEPMIDLLWDRMGFAGDISKADEGTRERAMALGRWIDEHGLPAIRAACRKHRIQPSDDGPSARLEFTEGGYTIVANPNGSCGYLYIAAWGHVS